VSVAHEPAPYRYQVETRCLFFPIPEDENSAVASSSSPRRGLLPGSDSERRATLERHRLRFAAEIHVGISRDAQPLG
jgi:hypothetical protein